MRFSSCLAAFVMLFLGVAAASSADLAPVATIAIPGVPVDVFGAIFVDPTLHRAFLTDRSNKGVDIIDTQTDRFLARVGGFVGIAATGADSGPQGAVTTNDGKQLWATDGNSTIKVIDLKAGAIVDTISTGGDHRTGEVAYDPRDDIVLVTNPDESPQFVTLISTRPGHKILAKINLARASEGLERPAYAAQTGMFYVPVPSLDPARKAGGVAIVDPRTGKLVALDPTDNCNPHSMVVVSKTKLMSGCNYGPTGSGKGQLAVFDPASGKLVATGAGLGGDGQTALDLPAGRYYAAANKNPGGPVIKVVDVRSLASLQTIKTWDGSHSIAVDPKTHRLYLPTAAKSGPCGGCIQVYAPTKP